MNIREFTGTFQFILDIPVLIRVRDGNLVFEMLEGIEEQLAKVPECNDFRRLGDGTWIAYSTVLDEEGLAIRANAPTLTEALEALKQKLNENRGE